MSKKFPIEFAHLKRFEKYCQHIKGTTYGFYISQFLNNSFKVNPDWLDFRMEVIGSSEIGTVCDLDEYGVLAKIFDEKVKLERSSFSNRWTKFGHIMEPHVAKDMWQYWDGSEDSWIGNSDANRVIRKLQAINCFAVNTKWPRLSASCDYMANKGQQSFFLDQTIDFNFPVEIKVVSEFAIKKYKTPMPPKYIAQIVQQLMIFEVDYGEFAVFLDREREFKCFPATRDEGIMNLILSRATEFWTTIEKGRELYNTIQNSALDEDISGLVSEFQSLEPEPKEGGLWEEYLIEKYKNPEPESIIQGSYSDFMNRCEYIEIREQIKEKESALSLVKNKVLASLKENEIMSFKDINEEGKIVFRRANETRAKNYFSVE